MLTMDYYMIPTFCFRCVNELKLKHIVHQNRRVCCMALYDSVQGHAAMFLARKLDGSIDALAADSYANQQLDGDMSTSESLLIHRGHVVFFQCTCRNTTSGIQSVLSVWVYQYHHESKCFKKFSHESKDALVTAILGTCNILSSAKVACHVTGVMEPCVLLSCNVDGLSCYKIFQLKNLVSLIEVLDSERTAVSHSKINQCFLVDGPSLLCINSSDSEVMYMTKYANTVLIKSCFPYVKSKVFLLETESCDNDTKFTFIGQKCLEKASSETCLTSVEESGLHEGWAYWNVVINIVLRTISVKYSKHYSQLPAVYAPITTAVYSTQASSTGHDFLLATTYGQLVEISDGKVSNVCDIPFPGCSAIHVVGGEGFEVAVLAIQTSKCSCVVNLRSFTIAKVWNSVTHVASGTLLSDCQVVETVAVFHSNLEENVIDQTLHTLVSDLKDISKKKVLTDSTFRLKSLDDHHMDTECDLFTSPSHDGSPAEKSPALMKVIESFGHSVDRQRRMVNELRRTLSQHDQVLSSATQALVEMNSNLKSTEKSEDNCLERYHPSDLVDLFSAEPYVHPAVGNDSLRSESFLHLNGTWQRVIEGQWVIGFNLTNCGKRWFRHFSVLMHPCSHCEVTDGLSKPQTITTKYFNLSDLLKLSCKPEDGTGTSDGFGPGEDFIVTARMKLPLFNIASHVQPSYSVAILATAQEKQSQQSNEKCLILQAENVHLTATGTATNAFALDLQCFDGVSSDEWLQDYTAMLSCHDYASATNLSSTNSDVENLCEVALKSMGFERCQSLYICKRVGSLHLVQVELKALERQQAVIYISCKTQFEESLVLSCLREQFPNQMNIKRKHDFDEQRSVTPNNQSVVIL